MVREIIAIKMSHNGYSTFKKSISFISKRIWVKGRRRGKGVCKSGNETLQERLKRNVSSAITSNNLSKMCSSRMNIWTSTGFVFHHA